MIAQIETKLKCSGCKCKLPKEAYSSELQSATWFGRYWCCTLLEWICLECWKKGIRYEEKK